MDKTSTVVATTPVSAKPSSPTPARGQDPFELMRSFSEDAERIVANIWGHRRWPFGAFAAATAGVHWTPNLEVEERDGQFRVRADLPGLTKDDVKVEVTQDFLTIEGERAEEKESRKDGYYRSERAYGRFLRTVALPEGASAASATATFKNGVLEVTIAVPVRPPAAARHVEIDAS